MKNNSTTNYLSDADYKYIFSKVPRLCIDILITKDKKVLLTKRNIEPHKGRWHLPGGRVSMREKLTDAVKRIAERELGVRVEATKQIGFMEFPHDGEFAHSVSIVFRAEIISGELKPDNDAVDIKYWQNMPEDMHPEHKEFLIENNLL